MKNYRFVIAMVVMGTIIASGAFAQAKKAEGKSAKNAILFDVAPLFKGLIAGDTDKDISIFGLSASYERLIVSHFSIAVRADLMTGKYKLDATYFGLAAHGRYYPLSESLDKFFLDTGIGFNTLSAKAGNEFSGLTFELKAGYKVMIKKFSLEPSLGYVLAKTSGSLPLTPAAWQTGLCLGFAF